MTPRQKLAATNICRTPDEANDIKFTRRTGKFITTITMNVDGVSTWWHASASYSLRPIGELREDEVEQLRLECKRLLIGIDKEEEEWSSGKIALHLFRPVVTGPEGRN